MNSSDEAVEALTRLIADHPMWIADNGRALDYLPEREAKISDFLDEARSIFAAFAAAVRAEAVADERRRTHVPEIAALSNRGFGVFCAACSAEASEYVYPCALGGWADIPPVVVAAGSVPVATPEPTGQSMCDLIVCSHCLLTPAEIDATDHHSGGRCPGPVATPEPPTSCERCGHPVHDVGCLARPLVHGGTYTCGCGGPDDVRTVATPEPVDEWECPECGATTRARMADKVATPPAEPADPPPTSPFEFLATACDHPGATGPHRCRPEWLTTWTTLPWCPGPVSLSKESSE